MPSVQRVAIPTDGRWHAVMLNGPVLHVDAKIGGYVYLYVLQNEEKKRKKAGEETDVFVPFKYQFRIFNTEEILPAEAVQHIGTAVIGTTALHVFRRN